MKLPLTYPSKECSSQDDLNDLYEKEMLNENFIKKIKLSEILWNKVFHPLWKDLDSMGVKVFIRHENDFIMKLKFTDEVWNFGTQLHIYDLDDLIDGYDMGFKDKLYYIFNNAVKFFEDKQDGIQNTEG